MELFIDGDSCRRKQNYDFENYPLKIFIINEKFNS